MDMATRDDLELSWKSLHHEGALRGFNEEHLQEAVARAIPRLPQIVDVPAYLVCTARRLYLRQLRERNCFELKPDRLPAQPTGDSLALSEINAAIAALPPRQRLVIEMQCERSGRKAMASRLNCSISDVGNLIFSARNALERSIGMESRTTTGQARRTANANTFPHG